MFTRNTLSLRRVETAEEKKSHIAAWGLDTISTSRLSGFYLSFLGTVQYMDEWNTPEQRSPSFDLIQAAEAGCYPTCNSANRQNNMHLPALFFNSRAEECQEALFFLDLNTIMLCFQTPSHLASLPYLCPIRLPASNLTFLNVGKVVPSYTSSANSSSSRS